MTRATWHTFTTASPVFGEDDDYDPFFEPADRAAPRASNCQERESRNSLPAAPELFEQENAR